jgi:hypothetical protein
METTEYLVEGLTSETKILSGKPAPSDQGG